MFQLMVALLSALMIYAASNGAYWIDLQSRMIEKSISEENERLSSMRQELHQIDAGQAQPKLFRDPARAGWVGEFLGTRTVALPVAVLSPFSIGHRDLYPYYFRVSTLSAENFINEDEIENPLNLLAGRFDVAFVIVFVLPLFILAVSYDVISGEREDGTLSMLMSQPVDIKRLLVGQLLLRAIALIGATIILCFVSAVLVGINVLEAVALSLLTAWSLAIVIYAVFWFVVSALVNSMGKSSATNAVALFAVWLSLSIIVPAVFGLIAAKTYPVESRLELIAEIRDERNRAAGRSNERLTEFYREHPELRPSEPIKNDYMPGFYAAQIAREEKLLPVLLSYEEQLARQNAFVERLRVFSPSMAMTSVLNDVAGTSLSRYQRFVAQVYRFHSEWQAFFLPKMFRGERLSVSDYEAFPKFQFVEEPPTAVLGRALYGLGSVLFLTVAGGIAVSRKLKTCSITG